MSDDNNCKKFSISMPPDLMAWVDQKVIELDKRDRRLKTSRSAVITDAVERMRILDQSGQIDLDCISEQGKTPAQSHSGQTAPTAEKTVDPSLKPAGGFSTQKREKSRKVG